ncbi:hypothetical protein GLYMA_14G167200v4 [Glycine max]|uniref:UV radiation resistance protein/autophagy-related protein 14 n=1 Tax=Glycine max TaxID=3847 RepID=A0A0R0GP99_SOYBN|nr:hypothetical protein GYH30_040293 [Glycine max]KRH16635.1 hypothetical protein GLYMA_14G167200v4 [Glycine max]
MARKTSNCAICENSNQASICSICVNYRLNEYNTSLKLLKDRRDSLYLKLSEVLVRKGKGDDQANWRVLQHEKLARLKEKLRQSKEQVTQGRAKIETMSADLKLKYGLLESALSTLEKNRVEQLEKFYPNLICTQSLGHVAITSELLHKESVVIKQICKLFPQRRVVIEGERRDGCSGQYDQICNARLPRALDPHSVPSEELSTSLGYMVQLLNLVIHNLAAPALHNSGFAGSCSRIWQRDSYWDARPSSRRTCKQVQQLNKSVWNMNSAISSTTLLESAHSVPTTRIENYLPSSTGSFLYAADLSDGKNECLIEGWDIVEHPTFPPPPSQSEDVEHWTRAMFIDAKGK